MKQPNREATEAAIDVEANTTRSSEGAKVLDGIGVTVRVLYKSHSLGQTEMRSSNINAGANEGNGIAINAFGHGASRYSAGLLIFLDDAWLPEYDAIVRAHKATQTWILKYWQAYKD
jgi:hypothetical protein